ncbi:MAG: helix-turn-helix domain-containing protein [Thiotrichales bacterium]
MAGVIGDNLLRLRKERGLTQAALAEAANLSVPAYRDLEKGRAQPRRDTLSALVAALDTRLPELMKPVKRLQRVRFRSLKRLKRRDQILAEMSTWLQDFSDLEQLTGEAHIHELEAVWQAIEDRSLTDIAEIAALTRRYFGLAAHEPVYDICGLLESKGIKVFSRPVTSDAFMGLSIAEDDGGPAIAVNTWERLPVETWIFSAVHELGHLLLHLSAYNVDQADEDPEQEKEADTFASHFLMPQDIFQKEWEEAEGLPLVDRVLKVKRVFRVSWRTVLYRAAEQLPEERRTLIWRDFNFAYKRKKHRPLLKHDEPDGITREIYQSALGERAVGPEPAGMDSHDFQGDRLWRLVRHAVEKELITLARAAEILGLSLHDMRDLSASWMQ